MRYDTTGPVRVNEKKSLVVMIIVILIAGGGAYSWSRSRTPDPATTQQAAVAEAPRRARSTRRSDVRRIDRTPDGVVRRGPDMPVTIKSGSVYLRIIVRADKKKKNVTVIRDYPRDEESGDLWATALAVNRMLRDPNYPRIADTYYNATADQLEQLKPLNLRLPQLTDAQQKKIADLYLATENLKDEALVKADKALLEGAATMTLSPSEQAALDEAATKARSVFRPDQLDLIDNAPDRRLPR